MAEEIRLILLAGEAAPQPGSVEETQMPARFLTPGIQIKL